MAFWSNWSDGKKWLMGIVSALIIAAIIGIIGRPPKTGDSPHSERDPSNTPIKQGQTTDQGDAPGSSGVTKQKPPPPPQHDEPYPSVDTHKGAAIDLPQCQLETSRLHCASYVTLKDSGWISVLWNSSIVDPQGAEVKLARVRLGAEEGGGRVHTKLIGGARTKLELEFDGVSVGVARIEALRIETSRGDFVFHNIRLSA